MALSSPIRLPIGSGIRSITTSAFFDSDFIALCLSKFGGRVALLSPLAVLLFAYTGYSSWLHWRFRADRQGQAADTSRVAIPG